MRLAIRILFILLLYVAGTANGQPQKQDSVASAPMAEELFYDSLKVRASRHGLTRFIYDHLILERDEPDGMDVQLRLLQKNNGKTIASIHLIPLEVFGPTFQDTARNPKYGIGRFGNRMHTTTDPRIIRKNLLFRPGDTLDADRVLENERIIRSLPFIKDARFLVSPLETDTCLVDLTVLTKDVFSFGLSMHLGGTNSGKLGLYNQNIWGVGHQVSVDFVGHTEKKPHNGYEAEYTVNNIAGNFVDLSLGYNNTYRRKGVLLDFEKDFLLNTTRWGGGMSFHRLKHSDHLLNYDEVYSDYPLNYKVFDIWSGYGIRLNQSADPLQLVVSGRYRFLKFLDRPEVEPGIRPYYSGSRLYLGSISLSKRTYIRDYLVYSYGISEDIPRGFLHEWVFGFDDNEFT
ncbi:MAG: hypothetical protein AB7D05_08820, partial [Mangrovibacterium sp.]